jgi:glycosyltransferase involved in cell wall biosynthesis
MNAQVVKSQRECLPPLKILVVGQTPPPCHGQAVAIEHFLTGSYDEIELIHVRMDFSRESGEVGRFQFRKVGRLAALLARVVFRRFRCGASVLYYPPAGPSRVPLARDLVLLGLTRGLFRHVVFHFHATGVTTLYARLGVFGRWLFRRAYFDPDLALCLSPLTTKDAEFIRARRITIVPNGVPDPGHGAATVPKAHPPGLLYAGSVRESKGVPDLIEACRVLREAGQVFELALMGSCYPEVFRDAVAGALRAAGLAGQTRCLGEQTGDEKRRAFAEAEIFCFPSYYEAETFPLVLLEAMAAGLPIVATQWRGIPAIVEDGVNGFLVPPHHPRVLAEKIAMLLNDASLRQRMGRAGRRRYETHYTLDGFRRNMEHALVGLQKAGGP